MHEGNILIVEDEADLARLMQIYLESKNFRTSWSATASGALKHMRENSTPDLILLDIELPDGDGMELCRSIRETSDVPIVFVTCRREWGDISGGLALGADDYVTKPFDPAELVARVQGHLQKRRMFKDKNYGKGTRIRVGRLEADWTTLEFRLDGEPVSLFSKEVQLLKFFMENPNQVFSVEDLLERVWGEESDSSVRTVYAHVHSLRKKVEPNPDQPELIQTVRGIGYKFVMK